MTTPRQDLIKSAGIRWRIWKRERRTVIDDLGAVRAARIEDVIESIIDECRAHRRGTGGYAMMRYYQRLTQRALARLDCAVMRAAGERK